MVRDSIVRRVTSHRQEAQFVERSRPQAYGSSSFGLRPAGAAHLLYSLFHYYLPVAPVDWLHLCVIRRPTCPCGCRCAVAHYVACAILTSDVCVLFCFLPFGEFAAQKEAATDAAVRQHPVSACDTLGWRFDCLAPAGLAGILFAGSMLHATPFPPHPHAPV